MTQYNLHNTVARLMAGEQLPTYNSPEVPVILAEVRAAVHDHKAHQALGWFVLQQLMSSIKASVHGEAAVMRAMNNAEGHDDDE